MSWWRFCLQTAKKSVEADLKKALQLQEELKAEAEKAKKELQECLQEVRPSVELLGLVKAFYDWWRRVCVIHVSLFARSKTWLGDFRIQFGVEGKQL